MPANTTNDLTNFERDREAQENLSGRDRLISNVIFSWGAHLVFILAGFILPRMIDRNLGQEVLGVWDFAWSLVSYLRLVQAGIASSVNRYVARYRAANDNAGINRIVSTTCLILFIAGMLVLGLAASISWLLPELFGSRLGANTVEAQWVVFFLGVSLSVQMAFSPYGGVLTGYHRWDLQNAVNSGWHMAIVAGMIAMLLMGYGLRMLAVINLVGMLLTGVSRAILAHRVSKNLRVRLSLVRRASIRNVFVFGSKTLVPSVSKLLVNQTVNILILAYLGPAALALYARPRSLLRHVDTLVHKMAMVLIPTASSLQSSDDLGGIRELLVKSVRYSLYMVLPIVMLLSVFGGEIMGLWMGPEYADGLLLAILAIGFLAMMAQTPILMILVGLNAHGRAGIAQFVASISAVGLTFLVLGPLAGNLTGVALAVVSPLTIINLTYLPLLICRRTGLRSCDYVKQVTLGPMIHTSPFAVCLILSRLMWSGKPLMGLLIGGILGCVVLMMTYWRCVLPSRLRNPIRGYLFKLAKATRLLGTT